MTEKLKSHIKKKVKTEGSKRNNMQHRLVSEDSTDCSDDLSSEFLNSLVNIILAERNYIKSKSTLSILSKMITPENLGLWRGWIVLGESRPIAVLTSENSTKKERKKDETFRFSDPDEDFISKLSNLVSTSTYQPEIIAIKNVKVKGKQYDLTDLKEYNTSFQQLSGFSLFNGDTERPQEMKTEIASKYNLPEVYQERGSQASSTKLRIFKATVTYKKGPVCTLNDRSREKLFLLFSPSDENVQDIINNAQIKNKIIRHNIENNLRPKKVKYHKISSTEISNKQLYTKRWIPPLKPVTNAGDLEKLPPLSLELVFDLFFKNYEIQRDGYSILIKEQPLLIENVTLFIIPKETKLSLVQPGYGPRYSYTARKGERVPEDQIPKPERHRRPQGKIIKPSTKAKIESDEESDKSSILESVIKNKLFEKSELQDDMDIHLKRLGKILRKAEQSNEDHKAQTDETIADINSQKITKWNKFCTKGEKAKWLKKQIDVAYDGIDKELVASDLPDDATMHPTDFDISILSTASIFNTIATSKSLPVSSNKEVTPPEGVAEETPPEGVAEETPPNGDAEETRPEGVAQATPSKTTFNSVKSSIVSAQIDDTEPKRTTTDNILKNVRANMFKLKKDKVIPVIKPILETQKITSKKRFYLTEMQQYWSDYHTDLNSFYHQPLEMSGHVCGEPIILDDRTDTPYVYKYDGYEENLLEEEISEEETERSPPPLNYNITNKESINANLINLNNEENLTTNRFEHIVTTDEADEAKHFLGYATFSYKKNKNEFSGYAPSTFYKNSKKETVTLNFCDRFLRLCEKNYPNRRKFFLCVENEYGIQKLVPTSIKPTALSFKQLDDWKKISKFVSNNVNMIPLDNPLYLPHVLCSPGAVLERGYGHSFDLSTLLASLLIGQGYDAYVLSGYANVLLTNIEPSRNYLRYDCPYLLDDSPTDPFQNFCTISHVFKKIEREKKPEKEITTYHAAETPYYGSSYLRQVKIDKQKDMEDEEVKRHLEEEEQACKRYLNLFDADEHEGKRIHSWVLVLPGKRDIEKPFFIEPSSGFSYDIEDPYYYGVESLWNNSNYWINRNFVSLQEKNKHSSEVFEKKINPALNVPIPKNIDQVKDAKPGLEKEKNLTNEEEVDEAEAMDSTKMLKLSVFSTLTSSFLKYQDIDPIAETPQALFDLSNVKNWIPLLMNSPHMLNKNPKKMNKKELQAKIANLQKCLDMPTSWCGRISITTNQVEQKINEPFKSSIYKRANCTEYQVGINEDGLVAKVTKFLDLKNTDPDFNIEMFERRRDLMYRRRRDIVSDKLTEHFAFGRQDCLKSHEFIDGADYMYCDHNIYFYWDFREDGLKSVQMTDLYLKLEYGGRKDHLESVLVLYGSNINMGRKKQKTADGESGKTPRKEIQVIVQEFSPSPDKKPWNDFAKITFRIPKNQIIIDYQYEPQRVTITSKLIKKSHNDPELGEAIGDIARKKIITEKDDDALSEIDVEYFNKELNKDVVVSSNEDEKSDVSRKIAPKKKTRMQSSNLSGNKSFQMKKNAGDFGSTSNTSMITSKSVISSKSSRSSVSEASFALSEDECTREDNEKDPISFYPSKLTADKDKSLWACSQENKKFMGKRLSTSFSKKWKRGSNIESKETSQDQNKTWNNFNHLTKDSPPESSEEGEEIKETKKRQIKAIGETQELFKAMDKQSSTIAAIVDSNKSKKIQLCKIEHVVQHVKNVYTDNSSIQKMKANLNKRLHQISKTFPNEKITNVSKDYSVILTDNNFDESFIDEKLSERCVGNAILKDQKNHSKSHIKITNNYKNERNKETFSERKKPARQSFKKPKKNLDADEKVKSIIDPLIINIYKNTDRCLEDPLVLKRKRSFAKTEANMKTIYTAVKGDNTNVETSDDDSETFSISLKKDGDPTISEEEAANEKDVDSVQGKNYNSDDNYSLKSHNASSEECFGSDELDEDSEEEVKNVITCQSDNESVIEYQTEAVEHEPYNFKGFHFNAGKLYARKMYQLKETCDHIDVDSDQQSSDEEGDIYEQKFLEGEIEKFLKNTVDKIYQDVKEAKTFLIGGIAKEEINSEENENEKYYCNLNDKYIQYVDTYFKKINKKREMSGDKAVYMELIKQRAKEPEKIIKHIKEYIKCKKNGTYMKLDENLMKLIPHVRPTVVKKKDRLGYEILTEDSEEDNTLNLSPQDSDIVVETNKDIRESIEKVNITTAELVNKIEDSHKAACLLEAVNNFKKFKDMETVNQLIDLPLHETFSDVNIRNLLQNAKVNDGYYIDDTVDGQMKKKDVCDTELGFVIDPDYILLTKDVDSPLSSSSSSEEEDVTPQNLRHMEIKSICGVEKIKDGDFFEPVYLKTDKKQDPFKPKKFRMFAPLDPKILDSDSDGSIQKMILKKRRKCFAEKQQIKKDDKVAVVEDVSRASTTSISQTEKNTYKRMDIDRTFGLEPISSDAIEDHCRVAIKNMSVYDEVSNVDKGILLDYFLTSEDDTVDYIRKVESYINNLLSIRRKERQSTKRNILRMSRKGIRRANFKVIQQKLLDYEAVLDSLSFDWDLLEPYLHLLLPEDLPKKFTIQTGEYIIRCLIIDFVEKELYKLKELFRTYEEARQEVVEKKNMFLNELEHLSLVDKKTFALKVTEYNKILRQTADRAHILRFIILRRTKQSTKKFLHLIEKIKKDDRIKEAYSKSKERLILLNLSKRWPEHFEFVTKFSGLPVACEPNDFTTSYVSPIHDIILRKVIKKVRQKPAKYQFTESTYQRYFDLMEKDREYYEGIKNQLSNSNKSKFSSYSILKDSNNTQNFDGKIADFINKMKIVNDLDWTSFFFSDHSEDEEKEEVVSAGSVNLDSRAESFSLAKITHRRPYDICSIGILEEMILIREIESHSKLSKESVFVGAKKAADIAAVNAGQVNEVEQRMKDRKFVANYGTSNMGKEIRENLPEYFTYI